MSATVRRQKAQVRRTRRKRNTAAYQEFAAFLSAPYEPPSVPCEYPHDGCDQPAEYVIDAGKGWHVHACPSHTAAAIPDSEADLPFRIVPLSCPSGCGGDDMEAP
jgi:hypothetical protein